jgi:hypothetical protein
MKNGTFLTFDTQQRHFLGLAVAQLRQVLAFAGRCADTRIMIANTAAVARVWLHIRCAFRDLGSYDESGGVEAA